MAVEARSPLAAVEAHLAAFNARAADAVADGDVAACEPVETLSTPGGSHELDVAAFHAARDGRLIRARVHRDPGETA